MKTDIDICKIKINWQIYYSRDKIGATSSRKSTSFRFHVFLTVMKTRVSRVKSEEPGPNPTCPDRALITVLEAFVDAAGSKPCGMLTFWSN